MASPQLYINQLEDLGKELRAVIVKDPERYSEFRHVVIDENSFDWGYGQACHLDGFCELYEPFQHSHHELVLSFRYW